MRKEHFKSHLHLIFRKEMKFLFGIDLLSHTHSIIGAGSLYCEMSLNISGFVKVQHRGGSGVGGGEGNSCSSVGNMKMVPGFSGNSHGQ